MDVSSSVFLMLPEAETQSSEQFAVLVVAVEAAPSSVCQRSRGPNVALSPQRPCAVALADQACWLSGQHVQPKDLLVA